MSLTDSISFTNSVHISLSSSGTGVEESSRAFMI